MPYILADGRKRCSPGGKRLSPKGVKPIHCDGAIKASPKKGTRKGCSYGRNAKTQRCYSKKAKEAHDRRLAKAANKSPKKKRSKAVKSVSSVNKMSPLNFQAGMAHLEEI